MQQTIKIGTRGSKLALWQANHVAGLLREAYPTVHTELVIFTTKGDKILNKSLPALGGKGLFTEELEQSLLAGDIDCAVHSLKDLPTDNPAGLVVGAIPERAPVNDVLVSRSGANLDNLPQGAVIGTSSLRRAAQLRHYRNDFKIIDIRGNVPTRISKALDPAGSYDATILAQAGVERLDLMDHVTQILPLEMMLPAPGQGAIGVQIRDDASMKQLFSKIDHEPTRLAVEAERAFLNQLEGGCSVPVAAHSILENDTLSLHGRVVSVAGDVIIQYEVGGIELDDTQSMAREIADRALANGAADILAEVRK